MKKRTVQDYSDIVVPEEIQKMSTRKLLSTYRYLRLSGNTTEEYLTQLKAELSKRENIKTKYEKKL